jgi:phenylalanyl-tRNA synthetase alpha chain
LGGASRTHVGTPPTQIDRFQHPKTGRESRCYRILYRSMDRSLTNQQVNVLQEQVRRDVVQRLGVELR